jgi:hypothetical protein
MASGILPDQSKPDTLLRDFVVISMVAGVTSLAAVTPLVFVTLLPRHYTGVTIGIAVWFIITVSVLSTIVAANAALSLATFNVCLLGTGGFTVVMCIGLLLTRRGGYRLFWRGGR